MIAPLLPGLEALILLDGHKETVVAQPVGGLLHKRRVLGRLLKVASRKGLPQHREAASELRSVIYVARLRAEVPFADLLRCQQPLRNQQIQIDEIRIAGKCGIRLVRAVPVAGGPHREHLPIAVLHLRKEVHKLLSGLAESADSVRARQ